MSVFVDIEKKLDGFTLRTRFESGNGTLALLGASGSGKSMTLRCIAGIERPDRGRIVVDGVTLFDSERSIDLPPQARRVGLLFQNYALFPHMTVAQNLRAGAARERDKALREQQVRQMLERFGLERLANRYPCQLSGGEQQRTALARILVSAPRILLLDEPFSALDSHLRFRLEQEVRQVLRDFGGTSILVSHDRDEVFRMADRVAVMDGGKVAACGEKHAVFANPRTVEAALLTGCRNISRLEHLGDGRVRAVDWGMELSFSGDGADAVGIRMHDLRPGEGENTFLCRVVEELENPFSYTVLLRPAEAGDSTPIGWELDKADWAALRADTVTVHLPRSAILLLKD